MKPTSSFAAAPRRRLFDAGIEWEELPSLADALARHKSRGNPGTRDFVPSAQFNSVWDPTLPADLDPLRESGPFVEHVSGLATREVLEPDVFRHFFA